MEAFIKGHAFFIGMALLLLLLSIICRFITGVSLKKLIREAKEMSATGNPVLKQCKLKFQNCCQLNNGVVNVSVFVEKFFRDARFGKCSLRFWELLSGQLALLSVLACGIGSCVGLAFGETLGQIFPYYVIAFLCLCVHFMVSGFLDVPGKQAALQTAVTDFLENRMTERIRSVERDSRYLEEEEAKSRQDTEAWRDSVMVDDVVFAAAARPNPRNAEFMQNTSAASEEIQKKTEELTQQEELETLLREFLA